VEERRSARRYSEIGLDCDAIFAWDVV